MAVSELRKDIEDVSRVHPNLLNEAKDRTRFLDRSIDRGIVNNETGSSIAIRENGDTTIAANTSSQYKMTGDNDYSVEVAVQSVTIANRKQIKVDELIVNKHKLNPALYELSDMRELQGQSSMAIGNLTVFTTVLVKAWEPTLKKWVLIRRLARTPIFSPTLNIPDVPRDLGINTDISEEILKLSKGER